MADLKDLINAIDINDMAFQTLTRSNTALSIRGKKDKYLEATFQSSEANIQKEAIIIWVDKKKLNDAIDKIKSPE
jgi:hypothetical protein